MLRVKRCDTGVIVEIKNEDNANSHREDHSEFMNDINKQAAVTTLLENPTSSAASFAGTSICSLNMWSNARNEVITQTLSGVVLDFTTIAIHQLKEQLRLKTASERYFDLT